MRTLLDRIHEYISVLSDKRLKHTLGVEKAAIMLKDNHYPALDAEKVSAAALLHDCTKELAPEAQFEAAQKYGAVFTALEKNAPKLRHAVTGAAVARSVFGLDDEVVNAILYHTTAKGDMTPMEKLLYLADFIDENRKDDLCVSVRQKYFEFLATDKDKALDRTLLFALDKSIEILEQECKVIHPHTIEARNFLKESLADEDYDRRGKR